MKIFSSKSGVSIIEMISVVVIIGAMMTLAIPGYQTQMQRLRNGEAEQILMALYMGQNDYERDNGAYTDTLGNLNVSIPAPAHFNAPTVTTNTARLAVISSSAGYSLFINDQGAIQCTGSSSLCGKFGYTYVP